ncbi:hypothetical protein Tco_1018048 [Tanacetum coccineum]|uniref:Reverse transcriptase domain-containing protein n=1 Tax=Tanacetum coccineum TaxID=301880 RepID=A0ABQ5FT72_9ASTR
MDDTRTMAQLLEAPTEGYEDAIVVPEITADNFELKHGLLTIVQNQFLDLTIEKPHAHIVYFNRSLSTMKFPNARVTSGIKAYDFPIFSEGATRIWLSMNPLRSILTWGDLVSKSSTNFSLPLDNKIFEMKSRGFQQRFD